MKIQKKSKNKFIAILCILVLLILSYSFTIAYGEETDFYVCFSNENYKIKPSNLMTKIGDGEYILSNLTLNKSDEFYVTDNMGTQYKSANGKNLHVKENDNYKYNIKFNINNIYNEKNDYEDTLCHVTYGFYIPEEYSVVVNGEITKLNYNNYFTNYDQYYISCVDLLKDQTVSYNDEIFTAPVSGNYRILFTPGKQINGDTYLFDCDGHYGSGDEYKYHIYIKDIDDYYVAFRSDVVFKEPCIDVNGYSGYRLTRNENNVNSVEYISEEFFINNCDENFKYELYEKDINGNFLLIDDDKNEDTLFSRFTINDVGWYSFVCIDNGDSYNTSAKFINKKFNDFYLAGDFNNFCYTDNGEINLDNKYMFKQIEFGDDDYDDDFIQYELILEVTENMVKNGDISMYITNGQDRYKDGTSNIKIGKEGNYRFLFSSEHSYGRGRNYRYMLQHSQNEKEEIIISSVTQFLDFANKCSLEADYSVNKVVYLASDLDFSNVDFITIKDFSGDFFGGYHTLKNISVSGDSDNVGVFGVVTKDASIQRLYIDNITINGEDSNYVGLVSMNFGCLKDIHISGSIVGNSYVGGICGYNGRSSVSSSIPDSNKAYTYATITQCVNDATVIGNVHVGGISGFNIGEISGCTNNASIKGKNKATDGTSFNIGGIVGLSGGKIYDCVNLGNIDKCNTTLYVGGIAGICTGDMYFSTNKACIKGDKYCGGAVGYYGNIEENKNDLKDFFNGMDYLSFISKFFGSKTEFEQAQGKVHKLDYIINCGNISGISYVGGVMGYSEKEGLIINNCISDGNIECLAGNYAGGIAGSITNGEIKSCATLGKVKANGLQAGNYVGGICGYGDNVIACSSSVIIEGIEYLGGISGCNKNIINSCYTNVLIIKPAHAKYYGAIAGFSQSYSTSENSFNNKVKYNYYIGDYGGIQGKEYAKEFDYAGYKINKEQLLSKGVLSPYLDVSFSHKYWQGGEDLSYPTLKNFEMVDIEDEFSDDELFVNIFNHYKDSLKKLAFYASKPTYLISFMEWNDSKGDLYNDDNEINYDNFECISSVRVYDGEKIIAPQLKYAKYKDGANIIEGKKQWYFAFIDMPQNIIDNTIIYVSYTKATNSLNTDDEQIFVEGLFDENTKITVVHVGEYLSVEFYLNDKRLNVKNVNLKYCINGNANDFLIKKASNSENIQKDTTLDSKVSGKYLEFNYSSGDYFRIEEKLISHLPWYIWFVIGVSGTLAVVGIIILILFLVHKHRKNTNLSDNN